MKFLKSYMKLMKLKSHIMRVYSKSDRDALYKDRGDFWKVVSDLDSVRI